MNTTLIVGLGNPGSQYKSTRHNVGFMVLDRLINELKPAENQQNKLYEMWIASTEKSKVLLMKPLTFMNKSGDAVSEVVRFLKIADDDVYIVHDDVDIPLGQIRLRKSGGSGGHNGVQSVIDALGHPEFRRIKIGVNRPPEQMPTDAYVLQPFLAEEQQLLPKIIDEVVNNVLLLTSNQKEFVEETIRIADAEIG